MSFSDDLRRFAERVEANSNLILRKAVFDMSKELVDMSPVDTGRFRNNWYLSVDVPNEATNSGVDPSGVRATARMQTAALSLEATKVTWITNSLPYAQRLEYGWSKQAPSGMVRIVAARWSKYVETAATGLR